MLDQKPIESDAFQQWMASSIGKTLPYQIEDVERYQLTTLNKTLQHAQNSPYYRNRLPDSITSLDNIAMLPFTSAKTIINYGSQLLCESQDEIKRIVTLPTSGSTGNAKRIFFTRQDLEQTELFFQHGLSQIADSGDTMLILMPCEREYSVGDLIARSMQRMNVKPIRYGLPRDMPAMFKALQQADSVVAAPVPLLALARYARQKGFRRTLKGVLVSTDSLPIAVEKAIGALLECPVFDHYGITEAGLGGAVACRRHNGMHPRHANLLFEVIDPRSEAVLPDGQFGELVLTTLTRRGMPLIRYRTGDQARFLPEHCGCTIPGKLLDRVYGRINVPNTPFTLRDVDEVLFTHPAIMDYRLRYVSRSELEIVINTFSWVKLSDHDVNSMLYRIPSIAKAQPKISVSITSQDDWKPLFSAKRHIVVNAPY